MTYPTGLQSTERRGEMLDLTASTAEDDKIYASLTLPRDVGRVRLPSV